MCKSHYDIMKNRNFLRLFTSAVCILLSVFLTLPAFCAEALEKKEGVYIYDTLDIIDKETADTMNSRAEALYAMTGAQIMIVCVDTVGNTSMRDYTAELFNSWKIGSPARQNGLLLVLAVNDREYWMLQGSGLKTTLTDSVLRGINDTALEPYFAEEKYAEGAYKVFDSLILKMEEIYSVDISSWDGNYTDFSKTEKNDTADVKSSFPFMKVLTAFLWILIIGAVAVGAYVLLSVVRRPKYATSFKNRRRTGQRKPYVSLPPDPMGRPNPQNRQNGAPQMNRRVDPRMNQGGGMMRPSDPNRMNANPMQNARPQNMRPPQNARPMGNPQMADRLRREQAEKNTVYPHTPPYVNREDPRKSARANPHYNKSVPPSPEDRSRNNGENR